MQEVSTRTKQTAGETQAMTDEPASRKTDEKELQPKYRKTVKNSWKAQQEATVEEVKTTTPKEQEENKKSPKHRKEWKGKQTMQQTDA